MSEIIVRSAEPRDFKAVQEIQRAGGAALLTNGDVISLDHMADQVADPCGIFGVAESDGEIVGFIYGEKLTAPWSLASYFAVRPDFRGTDAYKKLGQWFVDESKKHGVQNVLLYADAGDERLVNFYKHFGFNAGGTYVEMIKEV
ncbi:MAG: GNAT family N-acetyltransferase [Proteobacteria bacterium]|nr:GNAT family N-acetyltransferase [Pseudomonadota bacterium]